jgi:hypothetical protein
MDSGCGHFCLARKHGSATTICAKTFIVHALQIYLFQLLQLPTYLELVFSNQSLCVQTSTDLTATAYFSLLFSPLPHHASHKLSVLSCTVIQYNLILNTRRKSNLDGIFNNIYLKDGRIGDLKDGRKISQRIFKK